MSPLRIALISFEFPPAVAIGGIGTYAWEAAAMLTKGGHQVEVFAAGKEGPEPAGEFGIKVHRFDCQDREDFRSAIVERFAARHEAERFDVMESPELGMEGEEVAKNFPSLPRVVKLHTPNYLLGQIGWEAPTLLEHLRFTLGCLTKGKLSFLKRPAFDPETDPECLWTRRAHEVAAPSRAIGGRLTEDWSLDPGRISYFPLPYTPSQDLLDLLPTEKISTVGFLGRLEPRKGILEIAEAIPRILAKAPNLRFRLIGPSWNYKQTDIESWIRQTYPDAMAAIDFVGPVEKKDLSQEFTKCDLMLFPSRWESFGLVCPESMAAGRVVIGSSSGGMAEIIEDGKSGLLVPPKDPPAIVSAVLHLVKHPQEVSALARGGRQRIIDFLDHQAVLPQQVASYRRAIVAAQASS